MSKAINRESILDALRVYFLNCPLLKDGRFNIDFLPNEMSYSIAPLPADPVYKAYVDGGKIYQLQYSFTSKAAYDGEVRTMIEYSFFYQSLAEWVEGQNDNDNLPVLEGYTAISNTLLTSGYLFDADADLAQYQIQLQLLYE